MAGLYCQIFARGRSSERLTRHLLRLISSIWHTLMHRTKMSNSVLFKMLSILFTTLHTTFKKISAAILYNVYMMSCVKFHQLQQSSIIQHKKLTRHKQAKQYVNH